MVPFLSLSLSLPNNEDFDNKNKSRVLLQAEENNETRTFPIF